MADVNKTTLITLENLSTYDSLLKQYIDSENTLGIKTVLWDPTNELIKFYKKPNASLSDTATFAVAMSSSDVESLKSRVGLSTTLNTYNSATDLTSIMNILTGDSSTAGSIAKIASDEADAAETAAKSYTDTELGKLDADLDASGTAAHSGTFVMSGITQADGKITGIDSVEVEAAGAAAAAVAALDVDEFALASVSDNVVTIKGIKETDGKIAVGTDSTKNIVLEEVAYTGAAADVSTTAIDDGAATPTEIYPAGTVQNTLQNIARDLNNLESGSVVTITKSTDVSGLAARYTFSQGGTAIGTTVDIPADMVVSDGIVVDVVFIAADNSLHEESASGTDVTAEIKGSGTATAADAGKYIKLTIANTLASHLWIKATDLVDIYTTEQNADQIQLTINNNVISGVIVDGSVDTDALGTDAVTGAKIADDAVGAEHIAIAAHSESQTHTGGTTDDGLSITVTTTDGQVSAVSGSIAANTYDAYGTATAAVEALDSNTSSATNTADSGLVVLTEVGIVDGLISTKKSHTFGTAADQNVDYFLQSADYETANTDDINALFS